MAATRETNGYFFTNLWSGTWRAQNNKDLYTEGHRRQLIGSKRSFMFVDKKNIEEKGKWVMYEYQLHESLLMKQKGDLVVCRIYKKVTKGEKSRITSGYWKK